jgi:uncharacterized protein YbaP (TraB family)
MLDISKQLVSHTVRAAAAACLIAIALSGAAHAQSSDGGGSAPESPIEEVSVLGERPGPQMWRISKDDHVMWVLGTMSPLPKKMKWKSKPVEDVLTEAQEVLAGGVSVDADIGPITAFRLYRQWRRVRRNPDEAELVDLVPAPLYARFSALKAKYAPRNDDLETLQPMFAGGYLVREAIRASDLTSGSSVQKTVLKLAKRHRVKVRQIEVEVDDPKGLLEIIGQTPLDAQLVCLDTTLSRLEVDVGVIRARAEAWAVGDVNALRDLPHVDQDAACYAAVTNAPRIREITDRARNLWLEAAEQALATNRTTLALQSMDRLLGPEGLLAHFREKGYTIEGP